MPLGVTAKELAFGQRAPSGHLPFLAMLYAYLDESGLHEQVCVLAGFIGTDVQWDAFSADWKANLGQRSRLHMNDLRWSSEKNFRRNRQALEKLAPLPMRHGLQPIMGALRIIDHQIAFDGYETLFRNQEMAEPWGMAFIKIISGLGQWLPRDEIVKIIFERQDRFSESVLSIWNKMKKQRPAIVERVASMEFIEKGVHPGTELADFLAWEVRELLTDPNSRRALCGSNVITGFKGGIPGGSWSVDELKAHFRRMATDAVIGLFRQN